MSNDASFVEQIHQVAATAQKYAGWILRTFSTREKTALVTLWKTLIIPRLDYCSQLWCQSEVSEIQLLEGIQRSFTSWINGTSRLNYWERLNFLGLYSLEKRRESYLILYTWKIIEGLVPNKRNLVSLHTRRHGRKCKLIALNSNLTSKKVRNLLDNSFSREGPNLFNSLPAYLALFGLAKCSPEGFC